MSKERSNLGSKREIRPGVWEVSVTCGKRADGKKRRKSRTVRGNEVEADAAIVKLALEMEKRVTLGDEMTLGVYFWGVFLPQRQATTTKANTKTYESVFNSQIAPTFGSWDVASITRIDIQRWVNRLPPQSAPAYVRHFRAILNQAKQDEVISESPMEGVSFKMPKGRSTKPLPVWGAKEVGEALERLKGKQLYSLWLCMVGCGLSRSEALALDWDAITWADMLGLDGKPHKVASVSIDAACTSTDGMKDPKNDRRYRSVPMHPPFSDALWEMRGDGPICQSKKLTKDGYRLTGNRLTPDYIPKLWKSYFEEGGVLEGLPFVHINRMRATYSSLMQQAGIDSTIINAMQGRSENSQVLYTNYLNPYNQTFAESAANMSALVAAGS